MKRAVVILAGALAGCQPSVVPTNAQLIAEDLECRAAGMASEPVRVDTLGSGWIITKIQCAPVALPVQK